MLVKTVILQNNITFITERKMKSTSKSTTIVSIAAIVFIFIGVYALYHDLKVAVNYLSTDNTTATERKMTDLRQTEIGYFLRMDDNRLALVSYAKKQGAETVRVFYLIKGDKDAYNSKILSLEQHIKKVIKKSDAEWSAAEKEYLE